MPQSPIDFETKSDHDLLILTAQTCNRIDNKLDDLNGTVRENSIKLAMLEAQHGCETKQTMWYRDNGSRNRIIASISGAIALLMAIAFGAGKVLGWW